MEAHGTMAKASGQALPSASGWSRNPMYLSLTVVYLGLARQ